MRRDINLIKPSPKKNRALQDLVVIAILVAVTYFLAFIIKPFEYHRGWYSQHANWHLDELLITLSISFGIYSWRRWQEIKNEIAERRQAEEALRAASANLQAVIQASPLAILAIDPEGKVTLWNPAGERIFGWSASETLGRFNPIIPPDKLEEFRSLRERVLQGESITGLELRRLKKDGSYIDISLSTAPIYDTTEDNNRAAVIGTMSVIADITEKKRAEKALRESESKYRNLVENIEEMHFIYIHDLEGVFTYLSPTVTKILGYTQEEFLTHYTRYLTDNPINQEVVRHTELSIRGIKQPPYEVEIYHQDGSVKWLEVSETPVFDHEGKVTAVQGIAHDITERRQAEEALRNSEERFRLLFESNPQPIWVFDLETLAFLAVNDAAINHYGYSRDEFLSMTAKDFRPAEDIPDLLRRVTQHGPGIFVEGRRRFLKKDGSLVFAETSSAGIYFNYRPARLVLAKDITQRLKAEEALMESEERYRLLFQRSPMGIFLYDTKLCLTDFNDYFMNLLQSNRERLLGLDMNTLKDRSVLPAIEKAIAGEEGFYEGFYRATTGPAEVWVSMRTAPLYDHQGKIKGGVGIVENITQRKKAEATIQEERDRAQRYLEVAGVMLVAIDADQKISLINQKGCELLGYDQREIIGKNWFDNFIPPKTRGELRKAFENLIAGAEGVGGYYENPILTKSGEEKIIAWRNTILKNEKDKIIAILSSGEDITERRRLEEQLRQSQKLEAVGTLAGGIAHDFNNLLTAIIINLHMAKSKIEPGWPPESHLGEIENISLRAVQLIRQLLAFSRRQLIHPVPVNLNNIITNISDMLSRLLHEHIELDLQLAGKLGVIKADPSQMEQVIINLCINARDAMPKGGKLILKTQNAALDDDYISKRPWAKRGDYIQLEVVDTGEGMDEVTLARIFEPFFTTKEAGKGTGLGLSMVYGIIKQHQGYIDVYSEPGLGTIFKIYLPRSEEKLAAETAPETAPVVGGSETILLAEDEDPLREAVRQILEMYGYRVLVARDGQEAVELYEQEKERIDLVILDVIMPRLGGKEAADWIYQLNPRQKILFSSGYSAEGFHDSFIIPRTTHFIQKPYHVGNLAQKIREVLESGSQGENR